MTSGQAMAGDYMLNLGTEFYAYYQKSSESKILALETALADTSNTSYEPIGYAIGAILTEAFEIQVGEDDESTRGALLRVCDGPGQIFGLL